MFYGQFGEDIYLSFFFHSNYIGVCVEVGADDGINGSNTYHFEQKGWNTLCIEPVPQSFEKCKLIRKNVINCCAHSCNKDNAIFTVVNIADTTSGISSLEIDERLIENYKHLINNIHQIYVKVKTLDTILKENNFPKNIDFISIDTENTEIEVLKGIGFENYNINFLVIENNFNENIVEKYLTTKGFQKINRLGVNDFYVNKNYLKDIFVFERFEIIHANYYMYEDSILGNITDIFKVYMKRYILSNYNDNTLLVCNDVFTHTFKENNKKLYLTFFDKVNNKLHKVVFNENEVVDLNKLFVF